MLAGRGTSTSLIRHRHADPRSHLFCTVSWRESFILVGGAQRPRCGKGGGQRTGNGCEVAGCALSSFSPILSPDLLKIDLGIKNSQPCQRLFSVCDRMLRGHHHLRSAYVSLRASPIPRTSTVRRLYKPHARPLVRVVYGLPTLWEPAVATVGGVRL